MYRFIIFILREEVFSLFSTLCCSGRIRVVSLKGQCVCRTTKWFSTDAWRGVPYPNRVPIPFPCVIHVPLDAKVASGESVREVRWVSFN